MKITQNKAKGLNRSFSVVIPADEFKAASDKKLTELSKKIKLPGFRPGKAPFAVIKQKYEGAVKGEVAEDLIQKAVAEALAENKIKAANTPKIDKVKLENGKDFEFSIEVEALPEVKVPALEKINVTKLQAKADDKEIKSTIDNLLLSHRKTEKTDEKRAAKKDDVLVIDFTGFIDGKEFQGGKGKDCYIQLGSNTFIPGFEDQLIGAKVGDDVKVDVTFPKDYTVPELKGKKASFDVKVKELRKMIVPDLNDDFAKKLGAKDLDGLRKMISDVLNNEYEQLSKLHLKRALLDALDPLCDFEAPKSMLDAELDSILAEIERSKKNGTLDEQDKKKSKDDFSKEYKPVAERRVKLGLLLAKIADENKITLSGQDIQKAIMAEVQRYPAQSKEIFEFYKKNPQAVERLKGPVFEEKVIDFVTGKVKLTIKELSGEQLRAFDPDKK